LLLQVQKIFTKKKLNADHVHWQVEMRWVTPHTAAPSLSDSLQDDCDSLEGEGEKKKENGHRSSGGAVKTGGEATAGGEAHARGEAEAIAHTPRWEIVLKSTHGAVMDVMDEASLEQVLVFLSFPMVV
jgi:hypothetical protein